MQYKPRPQAVVPKLRPLYPCPPVPQAGVTMPTTFRPINYKSVNHVFQIYFENKNLWKRRTKNCLRYIAICYLNTDIVS